MIPRVAAGLLVSALVRRTEAAGGHAMVLAKGDATSGAILLILSERGQATGLVERMFDPASERYRLQAAGPADPAMLDDYVARRRRGDPDLWVVELDCKDAGALAGQILGEG